jgi:hypothetical protein
MARYSAGGLTGAGSTTLPVIALYAGATGAPILKGFRIWNTTANPVEFELVRVTTAGTWSATTEAPWRDRASPNVSQVVITASSTPPTIGTRLGLFYALPGVINAGIMENLEEGLHVPTGVANGLALVPLGTGQPIRASFIFEDE